MKPENEPPQQAITVLKSLWIKQEDSLIKDWIFLDLLGRIEAQRNVNSIRVLLDVCMTQRDPKLNSIYQIMKSQDLRSKPSFDSINFVFLTAKRVELNACKLAFGIDLDDKPVEKIMKRPYWIASSRNNFNDILIVSVGEDRNVPCATLTQEIISQIRPKLFFLVGMCAGDPKDTKCGDVMIASNIWDYEGARIEADESHPRRKAVPIRGTLKGLLSMVNPELPKFWLEFPSVLSELATLNYPQPSGVTEAWVPNVHSKYHFACGEKLRVDAPWAGWRSAIDEQIAALDMESYGFGHACNESDIDWVVIKGVSDHADKVSKDGADSEQRKARKDYQVYASAAAAFVGRQLVDAYTYMYSAEL